MKRSRFELKYCNQENQTVIIEKTNFSCPIACSNFFCVQHFNIFSKEDEEYYNLKSIVPEKILNASRKELSTIQNFISNTADDNEFI